MTTTLADAEVRFHQVDVFTPRAGGGNPLGVVLGAAHWSAARMQRFAAWTELVETTFLLPPVSAGASYRLRIFTPSQEIAFAGHPSIGSAHVALASGFARPREGRLVQECLAGLVPVLIDDSAEQARLFVQTPAARVVEHEAGDGERLASILGGLAAGTLPPALVAGGRRWWLAELADERALRRWKPDHGAIADLARRSDSLGLCVFARSRDPGHELVVRAFPCGVGIDEDPASGAANGLIAAYLRRVEPDGPLARGYRASQGREIGRDARIEVRFDAAGTSWIGGQTQTVIEGRAWFPEPEPGAPA